MSRNNTSNQNSVLDNVFSGFPNLFASQERNASNPDRRIYQYAPTPTIYYYPYSPITQTNLRNQSQNNPCFHRESLLGSIFGGNIFFPQQRNNGTAVTKIIASRVNSSYNEKGTITRASC